MRIVNKRAEMTWDEILGLILGIAAVAVLLSFGGKVYFNQRAENYVTSEGTAAYFSELVEEFGKANNGKVGEFTLWQTVEEKGEKDWFVIYFSDKYLYSFGDRTFSTYGSENTICVCYWDGFDGSCDEDNCENLAYPIKYKDSYGRWAIGVGSTITIEKVDNEFVVREIVEGFYSGPRRLMDIAVDDVIVDKYGNEFVVVSSEGEVEGVWQITIEGVDGAYEGISGSSDMYLKDYEDFEYEVKENEIDE